MSKDLNILLDKCIDRMNEGDSLEECLASYPEQAKELEPLLRAVWHVRDAFSPIPRASAKSVTRRRLDAALVNSDKGLQRRQRRTMPFFGWPRAWATVALAIVVVLLVSSGVVVASGRSMPGELLYPMKVTTEKVRLALTPSDMGKAELHIAFAERRVQEIAEMGRRGEAEEVTRLASVLAQHLEEAKRLAEVVTAEGGDIHELRAHLEQSATQQLNILEESLDEVPEQVKPSVEQALKRSGEEYGTAIEVAASGAPTPTLVGKVGTIQIFVTDPPAPNVAAVWVEVSKIEVHRAAGPDSKWIPIFDDADNPASFNLVEIVGVKELLCGKEVEAGTYTQLRMDITEATIIDLDEKEHDAFVPSGRLKFVRPFQVKDGEVTGLVVDFDGDRSLTVTGAGQYMLKPVVKLLVPEGKPEDGGELEDTAPPEISVTGVSDGDVITSPDTVTISFTVTDDKDPSPTVTATLNGDPIEPGEEVEVSEVGGHKLKVTAVDASGNKAEEEIEFEIVEA